MAATDMFSGLFGSQPELEQFEQEYYSSVNPVQKRALAAALSADHILPDQLSQVKGKSESDLVRPPEYKVMIMLFNFLCKLSDNTLNFDLVILVLSICLILFVFKQTYYKYHYMYEHYNQMLAEKLRPTDSMEMQELIQSKNRGTFQ